MRALVNKWVLSKGGRRQCTLLLVAAHMPDQEDRFMPQLCVCT